MRFVYGRQDYKTMERGQENCYLLTNGLGGFSSATMIGSNTRNDHAFLMASLKAPNLRYNMVHRLSESLEIEGENHFISSQEFRNNQPDEKGYLNLSAFTFEDYPKWIYHIQGVEIQKRIGMKPNANTAAVSYCICNSSNKECTLRIIPFFQFVKKGEDLEEDVNFQLIGDGLTFDTVTKGDLSLHFRTTGKVQKMPVTYETYYYSYDACDGRRESGRAAANHVITETIPPQSYGCLELVYSMEPEIDSAEAFIQEMKAARRRTAERAGFQNPVASMLAKSALQFIAKRESTGGDTILAGYPFFEDWGRDTMIALPGCCIATKQYETAKSILRTFMANERKGLMPNLFPEGGNEPAYNTVDAALLFINSVYLYYEKTKDTAFIKEAYPVMEEIILWYKKGTDFEIHMDEDGLIMAGEGFDQVTWMDVRVGEILPTPRHGKPVEINAYWYNALCCMERFAELLGKEKSGYEKMAGQVKAAFCKKFWMEEKGCLKDVISGTKADSQIRCNQIWAVSMPFTMLERNQEKQVVETVFEKLYTPYGLRTLEMSDEEFHPTYGGEQLKRDLAYHQGTVWTFPLGEYYLAYLKVNDNSQEAKKEVKRQLEVMESALREGCVGQLPEIYDGEYPSSSKGCFAQAWSVGEILRVYEALED